MFYEAYADKKKTDCWNQAAATANCDPNADDDCLCGPFFDDVTDCTAAACGIADNLGMFLDMIFKSRSILTGVAATLDFLNPFCE
jgi:hypothetical protein